jgi:hypothetical protein
MIEHGFMKADPSRHSIPLHDYGPALRSAVSWLGDRYLLAEPVERRADHRSSHPDTPTVSGSARRDAVN